MRLLLLILLVILILSLLPVYPWSAGFGWYPASGVGVIIVILVVALLLGEGKV